MPTPLAAMFGELSPHQRLIRALLVLLIAGAALAASPAAADDGEATEDPLEQYEANRERQAELAAELDTLAASHAELVTAIETLNADLARAQVELDAAQAELAERIVAAQRAKAAYQAKVVELADLQDRLDQMVVDAFINPPAMSALSTLLGSADPNTAEAKEILRGSKIDFDVDLIDKVSRAKSELGVLAEKAAEASEQAENARDEQVTAVSDLDESRLQHQVFIAEVQARIDADFLEAVALADQNTELAEELIVEAEQLAARLAGVPGRNGVETVTVRGIRVHEVLAPQLDLLLAAAEADGVVLGGGGYRSTEQQVSLRKAHCGEDNVFSAPPGACSPPTAVPGRSMHEIGLAIDFTVNGRIISSRSEPAFVWLAEHAATYGLYNLPSEPWHWSVNGN